MQRVKALREKNQSFKLHIRKKTNKRSVTCLHCGGGEGREEDLPLPSPHCKEACSLKISVYQLLHPNTSMHILLTVLHKFSKMLSRRICLTIKNFFIWCFFSFYSRDRKF